jgi:hypothetical protein
MPPPIICAAAAPDREQARNAIVAMVAVRLIDLTSSRIAPNRGSGLLSQPQRPCHFMGAPSGLDWVEMPLSGLGEAPAKGANRP